MEGIKNFIEEYGAKEAIIGFSEIIDKRKYFSIENNMIKRKEMNVALIAVALLENNIDLVIEGFQKSIDKKERQVIMKIDRMSNVSIEDLEEILFKLLYKNSFEHSLKYGKELYFRDSEKFYDLISKFALMDNMDLRKPLLVSAFKKLEMKNDEIIYLLMSYLTKARSDYFYFENLVEKEINRKEIKTRIKILGEKLKTQEGLNLLQYLNLVEEKEGILTDRFYSIIELKLEKIEKEKIEKLKENKLDNIEEGLIEYFLSNIIL